MILQDLKSAPGGRKKSRRVGRGPGSGRGKTAGKGHKGQNARSGGGVRVGFEGGQMPLQRRLPKRGFNNKKFATKYAVVNVRDIERCGLEEVTPETLLEEGVIKSISDGLKVLGSGEITRKVNVKASAFSSSARKKIEEAGGTAEVI
ncbi:MAG: 50S ribosomal protein L15 [Nitrospirota bacterium]|jgi:large subunit ribosomal protein L15